MLFSVENHGRLKKISGKFSDFFADKTQDVVFSRKNPHLNRWSQNICHNSTPKTLLGLHKFLTFLISVEFFGQKIMTKSPQICQKNYNCPFVVTLTVTKW